MRELNGPPRVNESTGLRSPESTQALQDLTFWAMDEQGVVLAVASGVRALQYRAADPDRILAGMGAGPGRGRGSARDRLTSGSYQVIAEMGLQYAGISPDDERVDSVFALAEELDVPVGIHVGPGPRGAAYGPFPRYRMANSNPLLLEDVLIRHPDLRLYVMHAGWPFSDELVGLLWAHPQVYVDIAVIDWVLPRAEFHRYLRRIVEAGFADRVMFGSDQMYWPEAIGLGIEAVESAEFLSEAQKQDILCNNAARFLRLDRAICEG